jgi:hypothetical protein
MVDLTDEDDDDDDGLPSPRGERNFLDYMEPYNLYNFLDYMEPYHLYTELPSPRGERNFLDYMEPYHLYREFSAWQRKYFKKRYSNIFKYNNFPSRGRRLL